MELLNATPFKAAYTMGLRPDGRELLVVVVKGTFQLPKSGQPPEPAPVQADLVMADEFFGEPGFSAPKHESDFAPVKPRCDVLLHGTAYAPGGEPCVRMQVGLQVGAMQKRFVVVGNRVWRKWLMLIWATAPREFVKMPVSYEQAYGGMDTSHSDPKRHKALPANPAGRGFHSNLAKKAIDRKPLPNTEEAGRPIRWPRSTFRPMAFGPIGRAWQPRIKLAGTYDQKWVDTIFPFLPPDFDERYYQAAPPDQQIDHLRGGEPVVLTNLTPEGHTAFAVPRVDVPITFYRKDGEATESNPLCDTLLIEPDLGRLVMVWRAALPLKRNLFEMRQVIVGRMPRAYYRARELGKTWYPSLEALVCAQRELREEEASADEPGEELVEVDSEV